MMKICKVNQAARKGNSKFQMLNHKQENYKNKEPDDSLKEARKEKNKPKTGRRWLQK